MPIARRDALRGSMGAGAALCAGEANASDIRELSAKPCVARIWRGRTPLALADEYRQYLFDAGVKKIANIPGNRGVQLLMRRTVAEAEFMVVSY